MCCMSALGTFQVWIIVEKEGQIVSKFFLGDIFTGGAVGAKMAQRVRWGIGRTEFLRSVIQTTARRGTTMAKPIVVIIEPSGSDLCQTCFCWTKRSNTELIGDRVRGTTGTGTDQVTGIDLTIVDA